MHKPNPLMIVLLLILLAFGLQAACDHYAYKRKQQQLDELKIHLFMKGKP